MAKKKKKKFQKKQLISLFESGNYQKVISKIKQFVIEGLSEHELHNILTTSYRELAQNNFNKGDIARAIRDIDSLLKIDNSEEFRLIKLKYLCYIENFEDAVKLAEELIALKKLKKIQKEALFLYLIANLYSGNYELDKKLLKTVSLSKQRYILGFRELLRDNIELALGYFDNCNPRSKIEKKNLQAIKAIILNQEMSDIGEIKPLYRFLIDGSTDGLANTKNSRSIKKEITAQFVQKSKNSAIQNLLLLKSDVEVDVIKAHATSKEEESRLIYNNISILVDKKQYTQAIKLFIRYKNSLVEFVESATLLMKLNSEAEDSRVEAISSYFFSNYLKLHHKKIAPFKMDYILIFLMQEGNTRHSLELAEKYNRDGIVFLLKDLPLMNQYNPSYQTRFNQIFKKHSLIYNSILDIVIHSLKMYADEVYELSYKEKEILLHRLSIMILLLQNLDRPNQKYKSTLFEFFKNLSYVVLSFSYDEQKSLYLKLSNLVDKYITYFRLNRVDLPIDIKALYISIDKKESIKNKNIENDNDDDFFTMEMKLLRGDKNRYNFNEDEYDLTLIKKDCIEALKNGEENPFKYLKTLHKDYKYYRFITKLILDLLIEVKRLKMDREEATREIIASIDISFYNEESFRQPLVARLEGYAEENTDAVIFFFEYLLKGVPNNKRESVWYLKWIYGYLNLVIDYNLKRGLLFENLKEYFINTQERRKFKSLNAKYKKIIKKFENETRGVLF